jgi:hypothetical protein
VLRGSSITILISLLCILAVQAAGQSGQTNEPTPSRPDYANMRQDEDWSYLKDRSRRADRWDPIKYIPLGKRDEWYLSIGGEARPFYERFRNEEWGAEPQDLGGYLLLRYMLHFDLHMGRRARAFVQLKSGIETGRRGGPRPPDEDKLDVNQAFVDVTFGNGTPDDPSRARALTLRAGRQEVSLGSSRLVSYREGPNVRQSFDGLRAIVRAGLWRVDGFALKPVETNTGFFDDAPDHARTFWGVYAVRPLTMVPSGGNIDLYYMGLDRKRARFDQGTGRETRQTVGARLWNKGKAVDYNYELVYQFGAFGRGKIRAWTVASDTGYTFKGLKVRPRLGLKADVTSGDDDPADPDLGTFNPLFPKGAYFGLIASTGPANHRDLHPQLDFQLGGRLSFTADWLFFWRQSLRDGLYGIPSGVLRTGGQSRARFVGHQPGIEGVWSIDWHTTFTVNYARFISGPFLRETPPGKNISYFAAWLTYKF